MWSGLCHEKDINIGKVALYWQSWGYMNETYYYLFVLMMSVLICIDDNIYIVLVISDDMFYV